MVSEILYRDTLSIELKRINACFQLSFKLGCLSCQLQCAPLFLYNVLFAGLILTAAFPLALP